MHSGPAEGGYWQGYRALGAWGWTRCNTEHPAIKISDLDIAFPVELATGNMLEFTPARAYTVYDAGGDIVTSGELGRDAPQLKSGVNDVVFSCEPATDANAHARVTITT